MGQDAMRWNAMRRNAMGWDGMGWDGMGWDGMGGMGGNVPNTKSVPILELRGCTPMYKILKNKMRLKSRAEGDRRREIRLAAEENKGK